MPPTRALNTSRPRDRLQVTWRGPRNQPRNQSIVQADSVWEVGVLGEVLEGFLGVPQGSPGAMGLLGEIPEVAGGFLGRPQGDPWRVHVGGCLLTGPWGGLGGH